MNRGDAWTACPQTRLTDFVGMTPDMAIAVSNAGGIGALARRCPDNPQPGP